ncbi:MAG: HupE/UreJ family protein [Pseudomonadota bacterium]
MQAIGRTTVKTTIGAAAAGLALASAEAWAHAGAGHVHTFQDGLLHPLLGADHLAILAAVGFFAARAGRAGGAGLMIGTFLAATALGLAAGGVAGSITILLSVSAVAAIVLLLAGRRAGLTGGALAVAAIGAVHGLAHGVVEASAGLGAFDLGALASSALLIAAGYVGFGLVAGRVGGAR